LTAPTAVSVPFVALDRQHAPIAAELEEAFRRVLGASAFILGAEVDAFETEFADFCQTSECAGVASGTAALTLAIAAAGIGPGDEVIVPAHTFIASALGVLHAGATPVFCDVHAGTGLIDPAAAAAAVTERTAGILAVHLYGQCCDMTALADLAERHGLALIEDAAQAHGATWDGRPAGGFGTAACFSFYPSKNLGALGDAGAVCTNDPALAARVRALRHLGQPTKGHHALTGWNERLDGLQAAMLRVKLAHVDTWNSARRKHAAHYREGLAGLVRLLDERPESPCVYHLFPVRTEERDALAGRLAAAGVATGVHYSPACHRQPPFAAPGAEDREFPNADAWAAEELSLPMFEHLAPTELEQVVKACHEALASPSP
jgi:dTDP-3-amino-3,4,6-trideoxy-alpha-D-glucose transaminase